MLAVEGTTDQAVVGRTLKLLNFKRFGGQSERLDALWNSIVPTYPPQKGNLYDRLAMPSIFANASQSLAIYQGNGSDLIKKVSALLTNHDLHEKLDAFGVIADADNHAPSTVATKYQQGFSALFPRIPATPGQVSQDHPKTGIFVFPDNSSKGVVEHLLIECGDVVYGPLLKRARAYVDGFSVDARKAENWTPFAPEKALIAAVASLLKPGSTNTVTIADNLWISDQTKDQAMLASLIGFLRTLLRETNDPISETT